VRAELRDRSESSRRSCQEAGGRMKINFTGYDHAPESMVLTSELRDCPWAEHGCFKSNYEWEIAGNVITVRFTLKRLIEKGLDSKLLVDVKQHEQRHFDDYKKAVVSLKQSLHNAINLSKPIDMDNRMEWFDWDVNEASNRYHRSLGMMPTVKIQPMNPRPNP
jgi:hypothetical protein